MFATAVAGSLPKPARLAETGKLWPMWQAEGAALNQIKLDATLLWNKAQEDAGLSVIGDGEQSRQHLIACTHCGLAPMLRAVAEASQAALAAGARLADQRLAAAEG